MGRPDRILDNLHRSRAAELIGAFYDRNLAA